MVDVVGSRNVELGQQEGVLSPEVVHTKIHTVEKVGDIVLSTGVESEIDYETRILLIDDQDFTGAAMKGFLAEFGFVNVHWVMSGNEALRALQEDDAISIVVSDMRMPGLTGVQTMKIAQEKGLMGNKKLLFFSGNIEDINPHDVVDTGAEGLYKREEFLSCIKHIGHLSKRPKAA